MLASFFQLRVRPLRCAHQQALDLSSRDVWCTDTIRACTHASCMRLRTCSYLCYPEGRHRLTPVTQHLIKNICLCRTAIPFPWTPRTLCTESCCDSPPQKSGWFDEEGRPIHANQTDKKHVGDIGNVLFIFSEWEIFRDVQSWTVESSETSVTPLKARDLAGILVLGT